jgi:hypothetical protein
MAKWYYKNEKDHVEHGPVSTRDLKKLVQNGTITPQHRLKKDEMQKWIHATKVQGLEFFDSEQVASKSNKKHSKLPEKNNARSFLRLAAIGFACLGLFALVVVFSTFTRQGVLWQKGSDGNSVLQPIEGTVERFEDHPEPIVKAIRDGLIVFELRDLESDAKTSHYLFFDEPNEVDVIVKRATPAGDMFASSGDGHIGWCYAPNETGRNPLSQTQLSSEESLKVDWKARETSDGYEFVKTTVFENKYIKTWLTKTISISGTSWKSVVTRKSWFKEESSFKEATPPGTPNPYTKVGKTSHGRAIRLDTTLPKEKANVVDSKTLRIWVGTEGQQFSSTRFPMDYDVPTQLKTLVSENQNRMLFGLFEMSEDFRGKFKNVKNALVEKQIKTSFSRQRKTLDEMIQKELEMGDAWLLRIDEFLTEGQLAISAVFGTNSNWTEDQTEETEGHFVAIPYYNCILHANQNLEIEDLVPGDWILASVKQRPNQNPEMLARLSLQPNERSKFRPRSISLDALAIRRIGQTETSYSNFMANHRKESTHANKADSELVIGEDEVSILNSQDVEKVLPKIAIAETLNSQPKDIIGTSLKISNGYYKGKNGADRIGLLVYGDLVFYVSQGKPDQFGIIWKRLPEHLLNDENVFVFGAEPNHDSLLIVTKLKSKNLNAITVFPDGDLSKIKGAIAVSYVNGNVSVSGPHKSASAELKSSWRQIVGDAAPELLEQAVR